MNKFNFKSILLSLAVSAILFPSCKKDGGLHDDGGHAVPTSTVITITSPATGQEVAHHAALFITGKIEADAEIHGYKLVIRRKSDDQEQFSKSAHTHGKVVEFNENWENTIEMTQDMELEVIAIIDHDGNTVSRKVGFRCLGG